MTEADLHSRKIFFKECSSPRGPEEHDNARASDDDGENSKQDRVNGLEVEPAELSGVDFEQPESINALLQQQAIKRATACSEQKRHSSKGHQPPVDASCLSLGLDSRFHCLRSCWCSSRSSVQGIHRPLFW